MNNLGTLRTYVDNRGETNPRSRTNLNGSGRLHWNLRIRCSAPRCMPDGTVKPGEPTVNPGRPGATARMGQLVTAESATIS